MVRVGITPAWAGKRRQAHQQCADHQDHPRMGGEKQYGCFLQHRLQGSPPHGRGKVPIWHRSSSRSRITPAWAGKSPGVLHGEGLDWDHPRMGGEKAVCRQIEKWCVGSPPHGRGKAPILTRMRRRSGITPAWAGKRLKRSHRSGIFISGPIPFHSVLHRPAGSGGSRAGRDGSPAGQPQNAGPA